MTVDRGTINCSRKFHSIKINMVEYLLDKLKMDGVENKMDEN
jgi:hypothetical protein